MVTEENIDSSRSPSKEYEYVSKRSASESAESQDASRSGSNTVVSYSDESISFDDKVLQSAALLSRIKIQSYKIKRNLSFLRSG